MCQEITGAGWGCFVQTGSSGTSTSGSGSGVTSGATASTSGGSSESISGMGLPSFGPEAGPVGGIDSGSSPLDGTWTGYVENYVFASGSGTIVMTLKLTGSVVTGTIVFGMGTPPPPAADPNVGYPTGIGDQIDSGCGQIYPMLAPFLDEGFVYTIQMGSFDGSQARLQVGVAMTQLWAGWCLLQTPYQVAPGSYQCLPYTSSGGSEQGDLCTCYGTDPANTMVAVDCGKLALCMDGVCQCGASGCTANPPPFSSITFDMSVSGSRADGSVAGLGNLPTTNVHFMHQ